MYNDQNKLEKAIAEISHDIMIAAHCFSPYPVAIYKCCDQNNATTLAFNLVGLEFTINFTKTKTK